MDHMLRVDFVVVVDWGFFVCFFGVWVGCFFGVWVFFFFLLGAELAQRGERGKKQQSFCNEEGLTHLTYRWLLYRTIFHSHLGLPV